MSQKFEWPIITSASIEEAVSENVDMANFDLLNFVWKHENIDSWMSKPIVKKISEKKFWSGGYRNKNEHILRRKRRRQLLRDLKNNIKE